MESRRKFLDSPFIDPHGNIVNSNAPKPSEKYKLIELFELKYELFEAFFKNFLFCNTQKTLPNNGQYLKQ
jgi:hypothetical protein